MIYRYKNLYLWNKLYYKIITVFYKKHNNSVKKTFTNEIIFIFIIKFNRKKALK